MCGITEIGRVRRRNEDAVHVSPDGRLAIVADGMGGCPAGDVASAIAVAAVVEHMTRESAGGWISPPSIDTVMANAVRAAQERVLAEGCRDPAKYGLGTTLILAVVDEDRLYTCHVGDVRCYVANAREFEQITRDHTEVGALVRSGRLTREQARTDRRRRYVLQALGSAAGVTPEVNSRLLDPGAAMLLCSDGLWGAVSDQELHAVLRRDSSVLDRVSALVDRANLAGGQDNISAIVYEHPGGAARATGAGAEPRCNR